MKFLVIGDYIIDKHQFFETIKYDLATNTPVVKFTNYIVTPGGAGNFANELSHLLEIDEKIVFITNIFSDYQSQFLKNVSIKKNVESVDMIVKDRKYVDNKLHHTVETSCEYEQLSEKTMMYLKNNIRHYDCVILSDYGKGVLNWDNTQSIISICKKNKITIAVDTKCVDYCHSSADILKINNTTADEFLKCHAHYRTSHEEEGGICHLVNVKEDVDLGKAFKSEIISESLNIDTVIVTKGSDGYECFSDGHQINQINHPHKLCVDSTGCGDAFLAGFIKSYIDGKEIEFSLRIAADVALDAAYHIGTTQYGEQK